MILPLYWHLLLCFFYQKLNVLLRDIEITGEEEGSDVLKEHLVDELDYILVPEDAWQKLKTWYNIAEGQVGIKSLPCNLEIKVSHSYHIPASIFCSIQAINKYTYVTVPFNMYKLSIMN